MRLLQLKHIGAVLLLSFSLTTISAQDHEEPEAITRELEELVVTGERAWIEGNKAVFVPTKSEKNLSDSPATLVERMNIPLVIVDRGTIKNLRGQGIPVYINGEPATDIDLQTFWPKQTYRVEYIDHPKDPRFRGADAVLNFVMTEYSMGGVTKASASQTIPNDGRYNVSSKLVYRKMTFGALVGGGYSRDHSTSYTGEENYNDVWYEGEFYDNIKRKSDGHSWKRQENMDAAFNTRYSAGNLRITHSAGLKWDRNPGSGSESTDEWSPELFKSDHSHTTNTGRSISPQFAGDYLYWTDKTGLAGRWTYSHSHNNASSMSRFVEPDAVDNATREDVNSLKARLAVSQKITQSFTMWVVLNSSMDWFSTQYMGTASLVQRQWRGSSDASLSFQWSMHDKLYISFDPGIIVDYWHIYEQSTHSHVSPKAELNLYYSPGTKFNMSAFVSYLNHAPSAAQAGDVTIRQNELNWLASSPDLKNSSLWMTDLSLTWLPVREFNMSASLGYKRAENDIIHIYEAAPRDMGGVIKTFGNARPMDHYSLDLFLTGRLFDNKLQMQLQPVFHYTKARGEYYSKLFWFRMRGNISYTIGNFSINAYYGGPQKSLTQGGMTSEWSQGAIDLGVTYGNGNIYVRAGVSDIFHRHGKQSANTCAGMFSSLNDSFSTGRRVDLSVSYTFGYGKKVDRNIDIYGPADAKKGSLGTE